MSIRRFVLAICALLLSSLLAQSAPVDRAGQSGALLLSAGTGLPSVLNGSALFCLPGHDLYLQATGSTFFWFGWEGAIMGGYVFRHFGQTLGLTDATGFAGIGYRHIHSSKFFLGKETDATAKFEVDNCLDLNVNYVKFWSNGVGWTTGLDLIVSLSHSGFIPELHVGLVARAL